MRLSDHQKRVLAALLELELAHDWRWWGRYAIGYVVDAGGYHQTLQLATVAALKAGGLIQTERSSWPAEVVQLVRCNCGCGHWGLTNKGRTKARTLRVLWSAEARERIANARWRNDHCGLERLLDEDEAQKEFRRRMNERFGDDDDDDDAGEEWKRA